MDAPGVETFTVSGSMAAPRFSHSGTLLNNGTVLITGGLNNGAFFSTLEEVYDAATGTFTPTGNMITPRYSQTATLRTNGQLLIAGGTGVSGLSVYLSRPELDEPATATFT